MLDKIKKLIENYLPLIEKAEDVEALAEFENKLLGRKAGEITELMKELKDLTAEEKKIAGQAMNEAKQEIESAIAGRKRELTDKTRAQDLGKEKIDLTAPALPRVERGHLHPLTIVQNDLEKLCASMGFMVLDGPELESDYYNFTAVNIPADHPARDMQDTFYIKNHPAWVMRTHTSSVQVRAMQKYGAPLRAIVPGKCFRNESTDARHEHTFYQLEGFIIGRDITLAHLKGVIEVVARHLFGPETKLRLRPKYYPFVEPGVNGEVTCILCGGAGCRVCKQTGWMEIIGAGMIHPNVLKEGGIDPKEFQGFAFGFGLTRMAMLKYGIDDVRVMESGDLRFVRQF